MRKGFGIRERLSSVSNVLRVFRFISSKEDFSASPGVSANQDVKRPKDFNVQAHILGIQRMNEIELQKAMTVSLCRHEKWKAGGPL
ncbi:MAG: hypothetical protein OEZ21_05610 [Candidatus Bathyarchaeota archaeon]|nr:hypothetical protein [Candidatus Bathyarchaeota archaeon]MDH5746413.1 hypothetical protein [Candidatus Bathyarchaeota archaeon]